jgi:hypothetical protein
MKHLALLSFAVATGAVVSAIEGMRARRPRPSNASRSRRFLTRKQNCSICSLIRIPVFVRQPVILMKRTRASRRARKSWTSSGAEGLLRRFARLTSPELFAAPTGVAPFLLSSALPNRSDALCNRSSPSSQRAHSSLNLCERELSKKLD